MPTFTQRLILRDNLYWAWDKAKHLYRCGDIWFDESEVAHFEANLEPEINAIIKQFAAFGRKRDLLCAPVMRIFGPVDQTQLEKFIHLLAGSGIADFHAFTQIGDPALTAMMQLRITGEAPYSQ